MENQEPTRLTRPRKRKKKRKGKTWLLVTLICLLLVAGAGYIFRKQVALLAFDTLMKDTVAETLDRSYEKIDEEVKPEKVQNPFSILLLGTDERKNEPGRSDTIIFSVVRPKDGKVLLISIPRDTYTEIAEENKKAKSTRRMPAAGSNAASIRWKTCWEATSIFTPPLIFKA
ncbi:LCP family protein [Paenibacillus sp. JTLBN-2024]